VTEDLHESLDSTQRVYLIVNADDFGYSFAVSRGIIRAIQAGAVTATAVLANAPRLAEQLELLFDSAPEVDLGVHLNLTFGRPLSGNLEFPRRNALVAMVATRRIPLAAIEGEWRRQIERCLESGVRPQFLNSHEHVHMLPSLYGLVHRLADAYRIRHVRRVAPDEVALKPLAALFRVSVLGLLARTNRKAGAKPAPRLLGLAQSGRLNSGYFRRRFPALKKGSCYELMCHPGYSDPQEIPEPHIQRYHDWETELHALIDPSFQELCARHGISLIGYRQLDRVGLLH
jgi:predicted glycoside hydrolase/deacetylase ChbG (UPF0249 family)